MGGINTDAAGQVCIVPEPQCVKQICLLQSENVSIPGDTKQAKELKVGQRFVLGKVSKTPGMETFRGGGGGYPPFPLTFFR